MLIKGKVKIQDMNVGQAGRNTDRWLKSFIMTKKVNNVYFLSVKNSMYPNCIDYKCSDIKQLYLRFVADGKMGLLMKEPKHLVLLEDDDKRSVQMFARQIRSIFSGNSVMISNRERMPKSLAALRNVTSVFDPSNTHFQAVSYFDHRILNMVNLQKLLLENLTVNTLSDRIGDLPIVYLSLNNLKLSDTASRYERNTLWDWMSKDKIVQTLRVLKMDNIGLNLLPFELSFLRGVQILSLANNNLEFIPHYIEELNIKQLDVSGNKLRYFPMCLQAHSFHALDISGNNFSVPFNEVQRYDHIELFMASRSLDVNKSEKPMVKELTYMALIRMIECNVRFKRQDIPKTLWHLFDLLVRCIRCKKYILPYKVTVIYDFAILASSFVIQSDSNARLLYQGVVCNDHLS